MQWKNVTKNNTAARQDNDTIEQEKKTEVDSVNNNGRTLLNDEILHILPTPTTFVLLLSVGVVAMPFRCILFLDRR